MNELQDVLTAAKATIDPVLLVTSIEHLYIAVFSLLIVGILAFCYQAHRNQKARLAHIQAQKRWKAMNKRDEEVGLPLIEVEEYQSITQFLELDPVDTFIARKLGMLEQAQKDGLL